ncbi:hypothetical protein ACFC1T_09025 [Kitasatospora sp. NPDC056076]|uniref:hypothetical protein n=1 Tax=Kitasatospora sp. NPDC056076 TaxID=3345703 RepID=UPI0035E238E0
MSGEQMPAVNAFAETAALYHLLEGRREEVRRIIDGMTPFERGVFHGKLAVLGIMLEASDSFPARS